MTDSTLLHKYYALDKINSFNATFNFCVGGRGIGKTFGVKRQTIKAALTKGDQFIYVRRYKPELAAAKMTFFADVAYLFPDFDFRIDGSVAYAAPVKTRDIKPRPWAVIGYFVALSTSQSQKSVSYPKVKTILFDEFIIEKGGNRYLTDEYTVFINFYSTVDRGTDKTRVYFLANSVSIMNPYFIELKIRPDQEKEVIVRDGGFVACHFIDSKDYAKTFNETRFGRFIAGTEYAKYAVGNEFRDNGDAMIGGKTSNAKYYFTLETSIGKFSVWHDSDRLEYYAQKKLPREQQVFTLVPELMTADKVLVTFQDRVLGNLRTAWRKGAMLFDTQETRNMFTEVFKR